MRFNEELIVIPKQILREENKISSLFMTLWSEYWHKVIHSTDIKNVPETITYIGNKHEREDMLTLRTNGFINILVCESLEDMVMIIYNFEKCDKIKSSIAFLKKIAPVYAQNRKNHLKKARAFDEEVKTYLENFVPRSIIPPQIKQNTRKPTTQEAIEILAYLNTICDKCFTFSKKNLGLILERLKDYTPDMLRGVIELKSSQWKNVRKMNPYLRPTTLFCKSNCETYVEELNMLLANNNVSQPTNYIEEEL